MGDVHVTSLTPARWSREVAGMPPKDEILPPASHDGFMLRNVAAVALNDFQPFELGVVCEVFGLDRTDEGLPGYDFAVVAGEPGPLRSRAGFSLETPFGLERLEEADLIAIPAAGEAQPRACTPGDVPEPLLEALRAAVARGARVLSVCTGAFVLGAAGLLDGRRCTTHWRYARDLASRYPAAIVDPDVLYVDADPVITSAGTAAGIDACLYLVRKEQGSRVANGIARPLPRSQCDTVGEVLVWMAEHLDQEVTVEELAARAHMSPRTFARRFQQ